MRQRGGRTLTVAGKSELAVVPAIMARVKPGTVIHADEATSWDGLHDHYEMRRINHSVCYSDGQACTNSAESFFSRLRRMVEGQHHSVSPKYLHQYAGHAAWLEDHRRRPNGTNAYAIINNAVHQPVSAVWARRKSAMHFRPR